MSSDPLSATPGLKKNTVSLLSLSMSKKLASGLDLYLKSKGVTAPSRVAPPPPRKNKGQRKQKPKPRKQRSRAPMKKPDMPMQTKANADLRQFQLSLRNPFSANAFGTRVVDSYSIPTATYHLRGTITCTSSPSGQFCGAFLPSPCLTFMIGGVGSGFGSITGSSVTAFSQNTDCSYVISPTTLSATLSEYRVVSWGIRFVAKDTAFATKGKVYIAAIPTTNNAPSWNTFETISGTMASRGEYTIGMDLAYIFNTVVGLPGVRTFSMQDLLRGEVVANGVPCDSSFYTFKGTTDRSSTPWNTGQVLADEGVFNNTTGLVNATAGGRKDVASLRGGRAFIIAASGLPATSNEFDIEYIYHLEGTPNMTGVVTPCVLVPSSTRNTDGASWLVEAAVSAAAKAGSLIQFITDPANQGAATRAISFLTGV